MSERDPRIDRVVERLQGSPLSLTEVAEDEGLDPMDGDLTAAVDEAIFECETCGWWCERSEESDTEEGSCTDCCPNQDEDD